MNGSKATPAGHLDLHTAQTRGMKRAAATNFVRVGSQKLRAGTVKIDANAEAAAHHHGPLESVIYILRGRGRMRWGDHLEHLA
jgi:uncharacterized RmlC-like cupin family protein